MKRAAAIIEGNDLACVIENSIATYSCLPKSEIESFTSGFTTERTTNNECWWSTNTMRAQSILESANSSSHSWSCFRFCSAVK